MCCGGGVAGGGAASKSASEVNEEINKIKRIMFG
jgi:hypothetical protein